MVKTKSLLAIFMVITLLFTVACSGQNGSKSSITGSSNATSSGAPSKSEAPTPVLKSELLVSRWSGPHADDQKVIAKDYTKGTITIDDVAYANLKQKQQLSFQTAKGTKGNYDVVWVNIQWMKEYVNAGYLYSIDDLIKKENLNTSMYSKGMMDGCKIDGKTYGLPTYAQALILAYDSAVFTKEGQKVPENLTELINVAKYFKGKGTGISIPAKQDTASFTLWSQLLFSDDGYYFDSNGKLDLLSEKSVAAATAYDELAKYAVNGATAWSHDQTAEAVRMGYAPIGTIMSGIANQNHDPEKSKIVSSVKYTTLNGYSGKTAANNAFWVWAVPSNAEDPVASFKFIQWLTSAETETKMTLKNFQISAVESVSTNATVLAKVPFIPTVMKELANGKIDPALVNFSKLKTAIAVGLSELATTEAKPKDVMQKVQDSLKDVDFSK